MTDGPAVETKYGSSFLLIKVIHHCHISYSKWGRPNCVAPIAHVDLMAASGLSHVVLVNACCWAKIALKHFFFPQSKILILDFPLPFPHYRGLLDTMRLDILFILTVSVYYQAIARSPEIAPENPFFINSSSAGLRRRAEISGRGSPEGFVVELDNPTAAVSNTPPDISSSSQQTVPSGPHEADPFATGSTDIISLTGSNSDCSSFSGRKFRKRQSCVGKSKDDPARGGDDPDPTHSQTQPESGCYSSSGSDLRRRQYCRSSSGSDSTRDDSSSDNKKRLCPRNRKTLCCQGSKPSGIYTHGCSGCECLSSPVPPLLPRTSPSPILSSRRKYGDMGRKTEKV